MNRRINEDTLPTSLTLVERARAKDKDAWEVFAQLYAPIIYRWSRIVGLQDADAADVTQDVLLVVRDRIDSLQLGATGQSLRAWMRTITKNKCRDLLRRQQRHATAAGGTDAQLVLSDLPDEEIDTKLNQEGFDEEAAVMRTAVEILRSEFEDHTWQAFVQTAMQGRRAADVAADLSMSVGSVYTAKSRVLARLRAEFEGLI